MSLFYAFSGFTRNAEISKRKRLDMLNVIQHGLAEYAPQQKCGDRDWKPTNNMAICICGVCDYGQVALGKMPSDFLFIMVYILYAYIEAKKMLNGKRLVLSM